MHEGEWLQALRDGDLSWFPELVDAYKDKIYALAYRKTRNAADAEDLAQEIFLQFYRKLPLFRGEAALSTWLYRVAFNRAASYLRKRTPVPIGVAPNQFEDDPGDGLLGAERAKTVLEAMARLRPREREVLELFYFQGHSTARTAEILGISGRGVETRLRRARERMKRILDDMNYCEEVKDDAGKRPAGLHASKLS